jgi:hypothetical protein
MPITPRPWTARRPETSFHIRTAYLDHDAVIRKGRYAEDRSTALVLDETETGERLANATVCITPTD